MVILFYLDEVMAAGAFVWRLSRTGIVGSKMEATGSVGPEDAGCV